MNPQQAERLKQAYRELPDNELVDMMLIPREEYEPGIYDLVSEEVNRRGIGDKVSRAFKKKEELREEAETSTGAGLETVATFNVQSEALFWQSLLESKNIPCFLQGQNMTNLKLPGFADLIKIDLQVPEPEVEKALKILSEEAEDLRSREPEPK